MRIRAEDAEIRREEKQSEVAAMEKDQEQILEKSIERLRNLSKGIISHELEAITLEGLEIVEARRGYFLCHLIVPNRLSDKDGKWHVGAIATIIDNIGSAAIYSTGQVKVSVDFSVSYYSIPNIQEEVEIEAKVVGEKGRLTSVVVEIRRKSNADLLALGKQWMASNSVHHNVVSKL